jgi:hypothetical protein
MTDWSGALARAFQQHIEISGSSGSRGSHRGFDNSSKGMRQETARTSSCDAMVLVVPSSTDKAGILQRTTATTTRGGVVLSDEPAKPLYIQSLPAVGTTGTTGTTERDHSPAGQSDRFEDRASITNDGADALRSPIQERTPSLETRVIEWLDQHPSPSPAGACAWCGKPESPQAVVLPFGAHPGTHTWLHAECWRAWHQARRAEALCALQDGRDLV